MKTYDIYGWPDTGLETARGLVEQALGLSWKKHDSLYRGGDYYVFGDERGEHFILQWDRELDEELAEPDVPQFEALLRVEGTTRPEEIESRLASTRPPPMLVRRRIL